MEITVAISRQTAMAAIPSKNAMFSLLVRQTDQPSCDTSLLHEAVAIDHLASVHYKPFPFMQIYSCCKL